MGEIERSLRLLIQGDKEMKASAVSVSDVAAKFTSQLSEGYVRKHIRLLNKTHESSGEIFCGTVNLTYSGENYPLPSGEEVILPISTDIDLYLCASSGEVGDIRIIEIA